MDIERIKHYEELLNEGERLINNYNEALNKLIEFKKSYLRLSSYLESNERVLDVEADINGMLPKGLNTGVLAEDYLYDFLNSYEEIINKLA